MKKDMTYVDKLFSFTIFIVWVSLYTDTVY